MRISEVLAGASTFSRRRAPGPSMAPDSGSANPRLQLRCARAPTLRFPHFRLQIPGTHGGCSNIRALVSNRASSPGVQSCLTTKARSPIRHSPSPRSRSGSWSDLGSRQADRRPGLLCLAALLRVDDPGRAVGEQSERQVPGARAGVADGVEVGQPVDDHQVGDPQAPGTASTVIASGPAAPGRASAATPRRRSPSADRRPGRPGRLPSTPTRTSSPARSARRSRRCGTGPGDTIGRAGSKRDRGRPVEQPGQVARTRAGRARARPGGRPSRSWSTVEPNSRPARVEEAFDHQRQRRYLSSRCRRRARCGPRPPPTPVCSTGSSGRPNACSVSDTSRARRRWRTGCATRRR